MGYFSHSFILSPPVTSGDSGTWASAIATSLAACIALWLGTRESRHRRALQRLTAIHFAVSIKSKVNILHHATKSLANQMQTFNQLDNPPRNFFIQLAKEIDMHPIWRSAAIDKLVYLEGSLANELAAAFDRLESCSYIFKHVSSNKSGETLEQKRTRVAKFAPELEKAEKHLERALLELRKYAPSSGIDLHSQL